MRRIVRNQSSIYVKVDYRKFFDKKKFLFFQIKKARKLKTKLCKFCLKNLLLTFKCETS